MPWQFDSSTGNLTDPNGVFIESGYAGGFLGTVPDAINNKSYQYIAKTGPLLVGTYTMGDAINGTHLGPLAIPLTPDPANDMRGRSDFFVHADTIGHPRCASEGCIVLSHGTRLLLSQSADRQIQVV